MVTSSFLCRQTWTTRLILTVSLVAACGGDQISPREEFPTPIPATVSYFDAIRVATGPRSGR